MNAASRPTHKNRNTIHNTQNYTLENMKVIHIHKQHLRRLVIAILAFSFFLSFYLHSLKDNQVAEKVLKSKKHKLKSEKHKSSDNDESYEESVLENPADIPDPVNELINEPKSSKSPDKEDVAHFEDYEADNSVKKWRLEELDPEDAKKYPILRSEGVVGNYESRPPIPKVGSPGHDGVNTGEGGIAGITLNKDERAKVKDSLFQWGFNLVASDKVNIDRTPADLRMDECKRWDYPEKMAAVSVVLVFHNEGFSTLLRTVHSLMNYSPMELIHEIVMLDDGSTKEYIKNGTIDRYIERWGGIVKIYHNDKREGLIRARTIGGKHATGSILLYLDAHCEVEPNWLPPLILPIMHDYRISTVPMVDSISGETYIFEPQQGGDENNLARGAWDWNFDWKRIPLNDREKATRKTISEPFRSPAMAGGLFAISTRWFEELGYYDEHLEIWGGENFELSYKLWQCGGQLLFVPCSRVGHIYRMPGWGGNGTPDDLKGKNFIAVNYNRVIETWWDDNYKPYYYARRPENKNVDPGDLTAVLAIKEKLQCKSFSWFMKEIAYDITKYWPLTQPEVIASGILRNKGTGLCPLVNPHGQGKTVYMSEKCSEKFSLSWHEDIQTGDGHTKGAVCWDDSMGSEKHIAFWECHKGYGNQLYKYWPETKQIYHPAKRMCVMAQLKEGPLNDAVRGFLAFSPCDPEKEDQQWEWDIVNEIPLKRANKEREIPGEDPPELDYIS